MSGLSGNPQIRPICGVDLEPPGLIRHVRLTGGTNVKTHRSVGKVIGLVPAFMAGAPPEGPIFG